MAEIDQQMKEIVEAKQQLQVQNIDLLSEVDSLKIEKESIENDARSSQVEHDEEKGLLKSQLLEAETKLNSLMQEKDSLMAEVDRLRLELSDLSKKESSNIQQKSNDDQMIASLETELNELKRKMIDVDSIRSENERLK